MIKYFDLQDVSILYNVYTKMSERSLKNTLISNIGGTFVNKKN